jgi:hypothetical protein
MSDDEPIAWWQRRSVLALLIAAAIIPLLWPALPPLTDFPGHVARWHIAVAEPGSPLSRYYQIHWALMGNLGTDLIAVPLAQLIGAVPAGKLVMMLVVIVNMGGMLALARAAHGRIPPTVLFALPFAYAWPFHMGFANFMLTQGLCFGVLALWLWLGLTERLRLRAAVMAPIGVMLWICHAAGWGLFGLMAFGAELARLRGSGRSWPAAIGGAIVACLPLALPVLIMIALHSDNARANDTGDWFNLPTKFVWVLSSLRDHWILFDVASIGALCFLLYIGARERLGYAPLLAWPALLCLAAFLLLPRIALGGSYVDMRMMPAVWTLALLAIRPPPPGKLARALALAGLLFFGIRTAATTLSLALLDSERQAELGGLAMIPRGSAVLALVSRPCERSWSDIRSEHLPAFAILERDAFVNEQWAIQNQQYLKVRYRQALPFVADPSQLVYPPKCPNQGDNLAHAIATFPRDAFSHVWIIGSRLADPRAAGLVSVWTNGHSALYQVAGGRGGTHASGGTHARSSL